MMNDYDMLKPDQEINDSQSTMDRILLALLGLAVIMLMLVAFTVSSGCITMAKQIAMPTPEPTPLPTATPLPTPTPTPTPIPTPDYTGCEWQDNCYKLREWHSWYRENVSGYQDLSTHVTVYDYFVLPSYHYHEPLWGTRSYFKTSPDAGNVFLFIFINIYSDGDDVRQYGIQPHKFMLQVRDQLYYMEDITNPEDSIRELESMWDYAHIDSPIPYGYLIRQEAGSGIITAIPREYLMGGRSNAWDGYLIFQVPKDTNPAEVKVAASFDNLGGNAWWKIV